MKVLLVSVKSADAKGGIAVWTEHYLRDCKNMGIECDLVNTAVLGKNVKQTTLKRNFLEELNRTRGIMKQLNHCLSNNDYELAHLNTCIGLFGIIRDYYIAKKISRKGIPIVLHFHCDIPNWVNSFLVRMYLKKILRITSVNLVLCDSSYEFLKARHISSVKIANFVEENLIVSHKEIRAELCKVCYVGRISTQKGANEIFEVAKQKPNITFNLIGDISDEIKGKIIPSNVNCCGAMSHEEVIAMLDDADVFLFPSHSEGFSLALAEAMSRGLPCIATDVGANRDMLEDKGGYIVSVGDINAIVDALAQMINLDIRKNMSAWNIKKVRRTYTDKTVVQNIKSIYTRYQKEEK